MLSTGYNCRDLLNIGLMRPVFSPTEYIQIKGRGTRLFTFNIGHTAYEKPCFFLLDFCAVAEYFEEKYDYSLPLKLPGGDRQSVPTTALPLEADKGSTGSEGETQPPVSPPPPREIPVWHGVDTFVSQEVRIVGPKWGKSGPDDLPGPVRARHQRLEIPRRTGVHRP
jgi:hypothetical protein